MQPVTAGDPAVGKAAVGIRPTGRVWIAKHSLAENGRMHFVASIQRDILPINELRASPTGGSPESIRLEEKELVTRATPPSPGSRRMAIPLLAMFPLATSSVPEKNGP